MISLVVIELYSHEEVIRRLLQQLAGQSLHLYALTTPIIHAELPKSLIDHPAISWLAPLALPVPDVLRHYESELAKLDVLYFTTIAGHWRYFSGYSLWYKSVWMIHNGNTGLGGAGLPSWKMRAAYRYLKYGGRYRQRVAERTARLTFPDAEMARYFREDDARWATKVLPTLYSAPYLGRRHVFRADTVRLVIPGSVNTDTRDYEPVHRALIALPVPHDVKLSIVLLGRDKAGIGRHWQRTLAGKASVVSFDTVVSTAAFRRELKAADILLLPLRAEAVPMWRPEQLGLTKISGSIHDWREYGMPLILSAAYAAPADVMACAATYTDAEELTKQLTARLFDPAGLEEEERQNQKLLRSNAEVTSENLPSLLREIAAQFSES